MVHPHIGHGPRSELLATLFERDQTQDWIIHIVIPLHKLDVVSCAGLKTSTYILFVIGDVVVERQSIFRLKVFVNACFGPALCGFAEGTTGRTPKPGTVDTIINFFVADRDFHATWPIGP